MPIKNNRKEILDAFQAIGMKPTLIEEFEWDERKREFTIDFTLNTEQFIETLGSNYEKKHLDEMRSYHRFNIDKMNFSYGIKNTKMNVGITYDEEAECLVAVFIKDIFYNFNHTAYLKEWEYFLKSNSYTESLEQKKMVEIFSEEEGQNVVKRAMVELNDEMGIKKQWFEKEIGEQIENILAKL